MNPQQAAMQDVLNKVDTGAIGLKTAITNFMVYGLIEDLEFSWRHSPGEGLLPVIAQCRAPGLALPLQPRSVPTQHSISTLSIQYVLTIYTESTQYLHGICI